MSEFRKLLRLSVSHMYSTEDDCGPRRLEVLLDEHQVARIRKMAEIVRDNDLDGACTLNMAPRVFNPYDRKPFWRATRIRLHVTGSAFWWEIALGDEAYEWTSDVVELEDLDNEDVFSSWPEEEHGEETEDEE
jgi:hypothetical protein